MTWARGPWANGPWASQDAAGSLNLSQTANIALTGVAAVSGDIQIGTTFDLAQTANIALTGATAVSGDIQSLSGALDLAQTANIALTGVAGITGDIQIGIGLDFAQTNVLALAGVVGIIGDIQFSFEPVAVPQTGGGKPKKPRKRRYQVEIDGEVIDVSSLQEAEDVLEQVRKDAEKTAAVAIERATKAKRRPVRKVIADAKKSLHLPHIAVSSPDLAAVANQVLGNISAQYDSALHAIEIAAHLARRDREIDEDDEEVMLLL